MYKNAAFASWKQHFLWTFSTSIAEQILLHLSCCLNTTSTKKLPLTGPEQVCQPHKKPLAEYSSASGLHHSGLILSTASFK